jgi:serine protease Do
MAGWRRARYATGAVTFAGVISAAALVARSPETATSHPSTPGPSAVIVDRGLDEVSRALAMVAARVKPSVVYITSKEVEPVGTESGLEELPPGVPPELAPLFRDLPRRPDRMPRRVPRAEMVSSGSGFVVSPDGYILTNAHVVARARRVTVRLLDRREFSARVVGSDPTTDVAVLKIDASGLTPLPFGDSDSLQVGELVVAVGNPLGESLTFSVTSGIVSAKGRALALPNESTRSIQDFIQTDAAINPGNSGGPLVNTHGEMVGINAALASPTGSYAGYGFAVPANLAHRVMQQIVSRGRVVRAVLGISVRDASAEDAAYVALPEIRGVLVEEVGSPDSPARRAGLRSGDIIVGVDTQRIDYVAQLQEATAFRAPGDTAALQIARKGGSRVTVRVPLERAHEDSAADSAGVADGRDDDDLGNGNVGRRGALVSPLGIRVAPVDDDAARLLELPPESRGVVVLSVSPWGPAADRLAGLGDGPDVILSVEDTPVRSAATLRAALGAVHPGDIVTLGVYNAASRVRRVERVRTATGATP